MTTAVSVILSALWEIITQPVPLAALAAVTPVACFGLSGRLARIIWRSN